MAQLFDADGAPLGGEVLIEELPDSITSGTHWRPTVDTLENGGMALAWEFESGFVNPYESSDGIFGRALDTSTTAFSDQVLADIASPRTVEEGSSGTSLTAQAFEVAVEDADDLSGTVLTPGGTPLAGADIPPITEPQTVDMTVILLGTMQDYVG